MPRRSINLREEAAARAAVQQVLEGRGHIDDDVIFIFALLAGPHFMVDLSVAADQGDPQVRSCSGSLRSASSKTRLIKLAASLDHAGRQPLVLWRRVPLTGVLVPFRPGRRWDCVDSAVAS